MFGPKARVKWPKVAMANRFNQNFITLQLLGNIDRLITGVGVLSAALVGANWFSLNCDCFVKAHNFEIVRSHINSEKRLYQFCFGSEVKQCDLHMDSGRVDDDTMLTTTTKIPHRTNNKIQWKCTNGLFVIESKSFSVTVRSREF